MSVNERNLVKQHLDALLGEATAQGVPKDRIGQLLLEAVVELWQAERSNDDIASELAFTIENLGDDEDFAFMRP